MKIYSKICFLILCCTAPAHYVMASLQISPVRAAGSFFLSKYLFKAGVSHPQTRAVLLAGATTYGLYSGIDALCKKCGKSDAKPFYDSCGKYVALGAAAGGSLSLFHSSGVLSQLMKENYQKLLLPIDLLGAYSIYNIAERFIGRKSSGSPAMHNDSDYTDKNAPKEAPKTLVSGINKNDCVQKLKDAAKFLLPTLLINEVAFMGNPSHTILANLMGAHSPTLHALVQLKKQVLCSQLWALDKVFDALGFIALGTGRRRR